MKPELVVICYHTWPFKLIVVDLLCFGIVLYNLLSEFIAWAPAITGSTFRAKNAKKISYPPKPVTNWPFTLGTWGCPQQSPSHATNVDPGLALASLFQFLSGLAVLVHRVAGKPNQLISSHVGLSSFGCLLLSMNALVRCLLHSPIQFQSQNSSWWRQDIKSSTGILLSIMDHRHPQPWSQSCELQFVLCPKFIHDS